jgi:cell division protein FtsA
MVQAELRRSGYEELVAAGIVLTGGGSKMEGVVELAEEMFHMPVRLGSPAGVTGLGDVVKNPIHATGVGLLLYGRANAGQTAPKIVGDGMKSALERMKAWFQGYF